LSLLVIGWACSRIVHFFPAFGVHVLASLHASTLLTSAAQQQWILIFYDPCETRLQPLVLSMFAAPLMAHTATARKQ
jgi:hypothetical protein